MMLCVLAFTVAGSYTASLVPPATMGSFSTVMTMMLGVKFILKPVITTKEVRNNIDKKKQIIQSILRASLSSIIF